MKIFFVGVFASTSTNVAQFNELRNLKNDVMSYDYRAMLRCFSDVERDSHLIHTCQNYNPDLIILSKCNNMSVRVIEECNKIGKTLLWYMDPLHNFDEELIEKVQHCNYVVCALWEPYEKAKTINDNTYFVHEGFDSSRFWYLMYCTKKHDVSFIGSLYGHRRSYYNQFKFHVYKNMFNELHAQAVNETRINLNFTSGGCSDRVYKVLASRGFLLTESWPNMEQDFIDGKDLVIFKDSADLRDKIAYYLHHEDLRESVAKQGYKTVQKFTVKNWAKEILRIVGD